jgi:hypothetical protein
VHKIRKVSNTVGAVLSTAGDYVRVINGIPVIGPCLAYGGVFGAGGAVVGTVVPGVGTVSGAAIGAGFGCAAGIIKEATGGE